MLLVRLFILFTLSFLSCFVFSQNSGNVNVTLRDGDWDDPSIWQNSVVPDMIDSVVIKNYITISRDINVTATGSLIIVRSGVICGYHDINFTCGGWLFNDGEIYMRKLIATDGQNYGQIYAHQTMEGHPCFFGYANLDGGHVHIGGTQFTCQEILSSDDIEAPENWSLYPNPTKGVFTISAPGETIRSVAIYNMMGQVVYTTAGAENFLPLQSQIRIDIRDLKPGVYLVTVLDATGKVENFRVVRE